MTLSHPEHWPFKANASNFQLLTKKKNTVIRISEQPDKEKSLPRMHSKSSRKPGEHLSYMSGASGKTGKSVLSEYDI
jgi:hypothetical protein